MISPDYFAQRQTTDEEMTKRLVVPLEQVAIARREFGGLVRVVG